LIKTSSGYSCYFEIFAQKVKPHIFGALKLELLFENLDLSPVVNSLRNDSKKGPKGYDIKPIIRAFLAQRIENIPTRAALVRRLKKDPVLSYILGFGFYGKVPSEATLSRYFNKLAQSGSLELVFEDLI